MLKNGQDNRKSKDGVIQHSYQVSKYASNAYVQTLRSNGIFTIMSCKGNSYNNAVAESFYATLKNEYCFEHGVFENRETARINIFEYIETFYSSK